MKGEGFDLILVVTAAHKGSHLHVTRKAPLVSQKATLRVIPEGALDLGEMSKE